MLGLVIISLSLCLGSGCERDPLELLCDPQEEGSVVISEISGKQTGADVVQQWIEIFNTTDRVIPLHFATFAMTTLDGSSTRELVNRQKDAQIEPRSYGLAVWTAQPLGLPGSIEEVFSTALLTDALLELQLCHQTVDRIIYFDLPKKGALALDGALDPTAEANDEGNNWCIDQDEQTPGSSILGTPGVRNRPCN